MHIRQIIEVPVSLCVNADSFVRVTRPAELITGGASASQLYSTLLWFTRRCIFNENKTKKNTPKRESGLSPGVCVREGELERERGREGEREREKERREAFGDDNLFHKLGVELLVKWIMQLLLY